MSGKYAAALYDFAGGRIQRISAGMGNLLADDCLGLNRSLSKKNILVMQLSRALTERKFLEECIGNAYENYSFDHVHPRFPPLRTISFHIGPKTTFDDLNKAEHIIHDAISKLSLGSFAFLICDESNMVAEIEGIAERILNEFQFSLCEFWCDGNKATRSTRCSKVKKKYRDRVLIADIKNSKYASAGITEDSDRLVWPCSSKIDPSMFICRPDYYHLLKNYSESYGCIHFDSEWNIFPDVSDLGYCIGGFDEFLTIEEVVVDKRLIEYWRFSKDKRGKCQDCEFRYACPNPLSRRMGTGLASQPSNCDYDIERGTW
ncbi:MAG: hypothetical protein KUL77_02290 [Thermomonas sp.]|uniref:hypothetical protein n=1 Tax=Thermomonas sp. TaxID=1971895 RepID=UPI001EB20830|nr:hypothetical protein [Thermomonas sp.]MBV2208376.1 hypothetical protein [Thermomonas sp.]